MTAALAVAAAACHRPLLPPSPFGTSSLSVGEWSGTTSQGMPIALTVDTSDLLTAITLGYDFNGCSGTHVFEDLAVRTAPDVMCFPGPCPPRAGSTRAFGFADGTIAGGPYTQINGVFLPRDQARGQIVFRDYPGCGNATVEWSASRR
jgi:hypothetical protein